MDSSKLPICCACGSQYDAYSGGNPTNCRICDDPRQFVPASGQQWTNLANLRQAYKNVWKEDEKDPRVWSVSTEPKFAIGQRAFLVQTRNGNILWDLIALLDDDTIEFIKSKGGLKAIVISHPHFYTTYQEWADTFGCNVVGSNDDFIWLCRSPAPTTLKHVTGFVGAAREIVPGMYAVKIGGHFPGSLVLHWETKLFIADTFGTAATFSMLTRSSPDHVPADNIYKSAHTPHPRPPGQITYTFQWSYPNMIPLRPDVIHQMWHAIKPYSFDTTHGAFAKTDVRDQDLKGRLLESMKIQTRAEGWDEHPLLIEELV